MHGFPLDISKRLLRNLIGNLRPTDTFNVLLFSGGSRLMSERSVAATKENVDNAINIIDRQHGGGGTELLPALDRVLKLPKLENYSRSVIVVTDGYVRVEEEVFDLIRTHLNDANMFAFGIGSSVNRHIIEGMARVGMGEPLVITKPADAPAQADRFRAMIESPVLTKIKVNFNGFSAYDVEPPSVPDVLADRPVVIFGKWKGSAKGTITVTGTSGSGKFTQSTDVAAARPMKENVALRYLWARHRITLLSDYNKLRSNDKRVGEVTELGLSYNLLTAYTSFVAVDNQVRNTGEKPATVNQPLPLPEGVSGYAVGGGQMKTMAMAPPAYPSQYSRPGRMETGLKADVPAKDGEKRKAPASPTVSIGEVSVSGGIGKQAALETIRKSERDIAACCAGIMGPVSYVVTLTVNSDGTVKDVKFKTPKSGSLEKCIMAVMKRLKFARTQDGKEAVININLVVKP